MFETLREQGYPGSYSRVSAFIRKWQEERSENPKRSAYVPLTFALGEAFQFDWSCEYTFIGAFADVSKSPTSSSAPATRPGS